jgi:hypothetical protein
VNVFLQVEMHQGGALTGETFHTHLLAPFDASAGEVFFFAQLDAQLNKVSHLAWVKAGAACTLRLTSLDPLEKLTEQKSG